MSTTLFVAASRLSCLTSSFPFLPARSNSVNLDNPLRLRVRSTATADSRYQLKGHQRDSFIGRIRTPSKASVGAGRLWWLSYHTVSEGVPDLKKVLMGILGACVVIFLLLVVAGIIIDAFDGDDESESADIQSASTETAIGLGISRDAVEDAFSDFDLEDAPLKDGRERLLGEAPIGSVTLQLIGEDSNLEEAALVMTVYSTGIIVKYCGRRACSYPLFFLVGRAEQIGLSRVLSRLPTITGRMSK